MSFENRVLPSAKWNKSSLKRSVPAKWLKDIWQSPAAAPAFPWWQPKVSRGKYLLSLQHAPLRKSTSTAQESRIHPRSWPTHWHLKARTFILLFWLESNTNVSSTFLLKKRGEGSCNLAKFNILTINIIRKTQLVSGAADWLKCKEIDYSRDSNRPGASFFPSHILWLGHFSQPCFLVHCFKCTWKF